MEYTHYPEIDETSLPWGRDQEKDKEEFLKKVKEHEPEADLELIADAFDFCCEVHEGMPRKSGLPYYTHPLHVSLILLELFPIHDTNTIICALLHDTIEDCESVTKETISQKYTPEIAEIVEALSKIKHHYASDSDLKTNKKFGQDKALTYRKLFLSLVKDIRVILIKLADRLHNMRTMQYMKHQKQLEISQETLDFYVPFAHRLGLNLAKMELENRSFFYTQNIFYEEIREELDKKRLGFTKYINVFVQTITDSLEAAKIDHVITIVHKHEYEIYKMIKEGAPLSNIDNFYSLVIILNSDKPSDCYNAYGILTTAFKTVKFIDQIANSKIDWYQSLRLDVIGPDGKKVEILIRTEEMERIAEEGFFTSNKKEKQNFRALKFNDKDLSIWGEWMEGIIAEQGENATRLIWNSIKVNIFDSALTLFSKSGDAIYLPKGSTLLDYSFAIYGDEAIHTIAGKVNGNTVDYEYKLQDNDQVEILKSPNFLPVPEWLNFVVSYKAVSRLYYYFKSTNEELQVMPNIKKEDVHLVIKGNDRPRMSSDISNAVGQYNILSVSLDTSQNGTFKGNLGVELTDKRQLNHLFLRLFELDGINSVQVMD